MRTKSVWEPLSKSSADPGCSGTMAAMMVSSVVFSVEGTVAFCVSKDTSFTAFLPSPPTGSQSVAFICIP